jgi:hypothetical protein
MDWIDLAQDVVQWRTVVNTVVKLWVPKNVVVGMTETNSV